MRAPATAAVCTVHWTSAAAAAAGEESKVVLVSLVRSNEGGKAGFLNTSNRVNVLLSRAMHGMVLVGNAKTFLSGRTTPLCAPSAAPSWRPGMQLRIERDRDDHGSVLRCTAPCHALQAIPAGTPQLCWQPTAVQARAHRQSCAAGARSSTPWPSKGSSANSCPCAAPTTQTTRSWPSPPETLLCWPATAAAAGSASSGGPVGTPARAGQHSLHSAMPHQQCRVTIGMHSTLPLAMSTPDVLPGPPWATCVGRLQRWRHACPQVPHR